MGKVVDNWKNVSIIELPNKMIGETMKYGYTTTTYLRANYASMQPNDNLVRVIPLDQVESFTVVIDEYIKLFGADRASRLERNLNCCFQWEEGGGVILVHRKFHYSPKKWWQFWKKKTILAVTLEVR